MKYGLWFSCQNFTWYITQRAQTNTIHEGIREKDVQATNQEYNRVKFVSMFPCPMAAVGMKTYVKIQKCRSFERTKTNSKADEQNGALDTLELSYIFCYFLQLVHLVHCPGFLWNIVKKKMWHQQWWIHWTTKQGDHLRAPSVTWQLLMWLILSLL